MPDCGNKERMNEQMTSPWPVRMHDAICARGPSSGTLRLASELIDTWVCPTTDSLEREQHQHTPTPAQPVMATLAQEDRVCDVSSLRPKEVREGNSHIWKKPCLMARNSAVTPTSVLRIPADCLLADLLSSGLGEAIKEIS